MKRILSWALSVAVLLTLVITVYAVNASDLKITISNAEVTLYETDETVTIVLNTPTCYNIEGVWSTTASGANNSISLKNLTATFKNPDVQDATTGKVIWVDYTFGNPVAGNIMTATYTIPVDTPAGEYTVTFTRDVFTGSDYTPVNEDVVYTATIKVTRHTCSDVANDGDHTCDDPKCSKTGVTECRHGSFGKDETTHWSICGECNQKIANTSASHDFASGDCVCGAEAPTTALLGDLDLDGVVDANDLTLLAQHVAGIFSLTDATALSNADVNGDSKIDSNDLTLHACYVAGIVDSWN